MKAVPDTMMWVTYCARRDSYRHKVLVRALRQRVRLFISEWILDELNAALVDGLGCDARVAALARRAVLRQAKLVTLPPTIRPHVAGDPDDNPVVQTALSAKADYLVTADSVLLALAKVEDVEIITMQQFEERLPPEA